MYDKQIFLFDKIISIKLLFFLITVLKSLKSIFFGEDLKNYFIDPVLNVDRAFCQLEMCPYLSIEKPNPSQGLYRSQLNRIVFTR